MHCESQEHTLGLNGATCALGPQAIEPKPNSLFTYPVSDWKSGAYRAYYLDSTRHKSLKSGLDLTPMAVINTLSHCNFNGLAS